MLRVERYLTSRGRWDPAASEAMTTAHAAEIERALAAARATPPAGPGELFEHVYARPPQRVQQQRRAWTARGEQEPS